MLLVVRVRDKVNPDDPVADATLTKRGDVIACLPDGHVFGRRDLDNPDWRIVRVPDLPAGEAQALTSRPSPEIPGVGEDGDTLPTARTWRLDLDALGDIASFLADDTRAVAVAEVPSAAVVAAKRRPTRPRDPRVIG